ncbi:MAG: hypothetical protein KC418_03640 [Anaerolineales bacterium]|nr:hypothetical protein [Anaerolineales bacterium]MCA9945451.1 hypothetical protein [Anaerolineales bacterium]MCB8953273.1 hypothetical protein [Ardenticatenales bacterium]
MEVFINECSLHRQFATQDDFEIALRIFFQVVDRLRTVEHQFYQRSDLLHVYQATRNKTFIASLNGVKRKDLRISVRNVLNNKLNVRDWTQERVHSSEDIFLCMQELVTDTSIAELGERILCGMTQHGLLINLPESRFASETSLTIDKNGDSLTNIDCVDHKEALERWLEETFRISRREYSVLSNTPPLDFQTILRNSNRFDRTQLPRQGGRILYREKSTGYIWYVDNLHVGNAAHFEVFDRNGRNHLGEADLAGTLDHSKRDPNKRLNV